MRVFTGDFPGIVDNITRNLAKAPTVHVGEWQAVRDDIPQTTTIELQDLSIETVVPVDIQTWQEIVRPNLPWAEEHFLERVSGVPHNPPPSHELWPFAQSNNQEFRADGQFSHTYPERMWPLFAGNYEAGQRQHQGIRFPYGDLKDLVTLLKERPDTRQAYLPIWFPEDLYAAAVEKERVPCTLGYHFLVRDGALKIVYYIRSCDFYRHFRDDVYMAGRLCQWVGEQIGIAPGKLVMHMSSLHIFSVERGKIEAEAALLQSDTGWMV